jgi:hypothetical protein
MRHFRKDDWFGAIGVVGLVLIWVVLRIMNHPGVRFSWDWSLPAISYLSILMIVWIMRLRRITVTLWSVPGQTIILFGLGLIVSLIYTLTEATPAAWGLTIFIFALFLILDEVFSAYYENQSIIPPLRAVAKKAKAGRSAISRWLIHVFLALACGTLVASLAQIESNFADEEYFVALQALAMAAYWLALRCVWVFIIIRFQRKPLPNPQKEAEKRPESRYPRKLHINSRWLLLAYTLLTLAFSTEFIHVYQTSFFPSDSPLYPGISTESPFLCGRVSPDTQTYDGQDTFQRLMELVEANPHKSSPEYGMLTLGRGEALWGKAFHDSLLAESYQRLFTGPEGSVKSVQHDAALRVYYYSKVEEIYPGIISPAEDEIIREWFAAINRRALTVEPVDWFYAIAFTKWPEGPYENQESGAGLLALLETTGLADPALSGRNRAYLDANQRGWAARFRVTDDAAVYQPEWLDNAFFQSLYTGDAPLNNLQRSFEWLLLQALPNGAPLRYNHIGAASLDAIAYLGAELTGDDRYLWLAGKTVDYLESQGGYVGAQPGLNAASGLVGVSPTQGSCLLYGDSGLPNQAGPLAPDKIVLRDGWQPDSIYLLLNLRFSGWHRYKATNTVTMLSKDGPLVVENLSGKPFAWLPVGRSLFRDKRIPRENLNGFVVARTGMSAVLYSFTGIGGLWAQDPPYYARVVNFDPSTSTSETEILGWRGWSQRRTIALRPDGLWVWDNAQGNARQSAAIVWHFASGATLSGNRVLLRSGNHPAEAVISVQAGEEIRSMQEESGLRIEIHGRGKVNASIVFHFDDQVEEP